MFKNKLFLNGLGTGLIVGAILLQLMLAVTEAEKKGIPQSDEVEPSIETENETAILRKTKELGYQVFEKDETLYTIEQLQAELEKAKKEDEDDKQAATLNTASAEQVRAFTVSASTSSSTVANLLLEMNLIKDKQAFEDELSKRQLNSNIQTGYYIFRGNPTMDEIILKITAP